MNLLTALIPLGLSMIMGGGAQQPQTGSTASSIVGRQGMNLGESFLVSMGAMKGPEGMSGVKPFTAPKAARPRSVAELTRGQPSTRAMRMDPVQRIVQSDPRVASAVSRMLTESSNQQMRDFSAKYATRVTTPQGRKTLTTKQPGDIKVGV
jgi:hypothetical protein